MIYRLELHQTEAKHWYSQIHDADLLHSAPLWESVVYHSMDDAYAFAKYELDERMEMDREAAQMAKES